MTSAQIMFNKNLSFYKGFLNILSILPKCCVYNVPVLL